MAKEVVKRDGRIVPFDRERIRKAIQKALEATGEGDGMKAHRISKKVVEKIKKEGKERLHVEEVQDLVERVLLESGLVEVARAYIIYREKRTFLRESKKILGVVDDLKLGFNAIKILQRRYLLKDEEGKVIETPLQMLERVSRCIAEVEKDYQGEVSFWEEKFFEMMRRMDFLPNSPTLMNAGTRLGQLSACFVIPVEDSISGIFSALKEMALIHQSGGGTGFSFSHLRPKGDVVRSTGGIASGPVSFMKIFDSATQVIKQGGRRRGANMGVLSVHHPDILEFITAKDTPGVLENFNLSVAITDSFMEALKENKEFPLINPRTRKEVRRLRSGEVMDLISFHAWKNGDPGIIWIDEINRHNPTPPLGRIEATNPCGEQPLLPYESCNLGSINLSHMVKEGEIDWEKLRETVRVAVHFLDNVIDANSYPVEAIERMTKGNRKIGLGVMGFADLLIKLKVPYDSEEAEKIARKIMRFIHEEAVKKSVELGRRKGSFPNFEKSVWKRRGLDALRNATLTTIAPTGSISLIAGTTSGIEPLFAISFIREVMEGTQLLEINEEFLRMARKEGFYSRDLMLEVARVGSVREVKGIPEEVKKIFVTSLDIKPEWHVRIQAAFQEFTDNAVSKTINFSPETTPQVIKETFLLAYKLKCKGLTVYRYGSRKEQVLYRGNVPRAKLEEEFIKVDSEFFGECRICGV